MASVQARAVGGSSREEGRLPATVRSIGSRSFAEPGARRGFRLSAIVQTAAQHPEPQPPQLQQVPSQDEGTFRRHDRRRSRGLHRGKGLFEPCSPGHSPAAQVCALAADDANGVMVADSRGLMGGGCAVMAVSFMGESGVRRERQQGGEKRRYQPNRQNSHPPRTKSELRSQPSPTTGGAKIPS